MWTIFCLNFCTIYENIDLVIFAVCYFFSMNEAKSWNFYENWYLQSSTFLYMHNFSMQKKQHKLLCAQILAFWNFLNCFLIDLLTCLLNFRWSLSMLSYFCTCNWLFSLLNNAFRIYFYFVWDESWRWEHSIILDESAF